ncbi:N-acyl-D-amino-acid deacylase family protein [Nocardioides ferulae]|uniref:N-acyl-D-amino-acid deacylase family protein n=1 Tax=Nocardioides ferulae TaxID=2340821 RepID=UPI000EB06DBA|nr:amidohydrolase family protein [Nocardioides ferulae]
MSQTLELLVRGGTYFDGTGAPGVLADVGISGGRVVAVAGPSDPPLTAGPDTEVVDATGRWVMPGFVDAHTHYDAEVQVAPGLNESVRHGVTTVLMGNCSISAVYSSPTDAADLFSRVEALPRPHVLAAFEQEKSWTTPQQWVDALERKPLGPNVASFLGHSDVRASVMGLGRATDEAHKAERGEMREVERRLEEALDAGFLGISTMTNPWDKLDGDRYRSRTLPSTFASWKEFRRISRVLRRREGVLQGVPNLNKKYDVGFYLFTSMGRVRKPLRVSLLAAADTKAEPWVHRIFGPLAFLANRIGGGEFTWQHLPTTFRVWADGIDLVVFEEFGSGREALHLREEMGRNALLSDEAYRRWFRKDFDKRFSPRVWHRDFDDAEITECPDDALIGRHIGEVARERGVHPVDCFLDLVVEHGTKLRWKTNIANTRPAVQDKLVTTPGVTIGFSDAGAHLRNMAFYNFGIRLLHRVHEAQGRGRPFLTVEQAVHKLTGELADFYRLDAGRIQVGDRADLVVVDPAGLDAGVDDYHEAVMPEFGNLSRIVNRNDAAVAATVVGGHLVFRDGEFVDGYGREFATGRFLRRAEPRGSVTPMRRLREPVTQ